MAAQFTTRWSAAIVRVENSTECIHPVCPAWQRTSLFLHSMPWSPELYTLQHTQRHTPHPTRMQLCPSLHRPHRNDGPCILAAQSGISSIQYRATPSCRNASACISYHTTLLNAVKLRQVFCFCYFRYVIWRSFNTD